MGIEKLFKDLDSNQSLECEEAKKKLMDLFSQTKEVWLVNGLMEYFFQTGSIRIVEVLVKVQSPHDTYLFDKLSDCLKNSKHRLHALELFGFVVRKHPTWLHKVKEHKFIKDILKLLQTEKEIVLLFSALLCIVTLLPIIPMIKASFLNELFDVFGHLASWNSENPNKLSEGKQVYLQFGLELLFHRLYGMYPCNFLSYLSEFAKKDQGAIFKHTIKPLLDSVRVHPMLVTANAEKEMNNARWKYMEAHDVVLECAKLSVTNQELHTGCAPCQDSSAALNQPIDNCNPLIYSGIASPFQSLDRDQLLEFNKGETIWSPYTEIASMTSTMPHTPTPSYGVPMSSSSSTGPMGAVMGVTGSSPPEAAVEATPETTPMKELTMKPSTNPHAVCAIFTTSQPASPMRRDPGSQFTFPESPGPSSNQQIYVDHTTINKIPTKSFDQKIQHVLNDRHQIRMQACQGSVLSPNNGTPTFDSHGISQEDEEVRDLTSSVAVYKEDTAKTICETEVNRFGSYRFNVPGYEKLNFSGETNGFAGDRAKIRRSNSLPTIGGSLAYSSTNSKTNQQRQHISKLSALSIRSGAYRKQSCATTSRVTQTVPTWPQEYEYLLYSSISENNKCRSEHNVLYPQELLNQYVERAVKRKDSGHRLDEEQFQLICLQLQFEQNRREIHAERIRRLMGRSRDIRNLEREQDRLKDNLRTYDEENRRLAKQIESTTRQASEKERRLTDELNSIRARYQEEVEHNKILQSNNEDLQCRLNEEIQKRKDLTIEVDTLRGQIFDMQNELQYAQFQAELGVQCKQELVKLETEFLVMGEVQMKLRDRLAEVDNMRARDEEIAHLQTSYNAELKDLRRSLEEKTTQFEIAKHKLVELQTQIVNNEKNVSDQKRLLNVVKDEYEEKFKALNKKYEAQKAVILQMEETLLHLYRNQTPVSLAACSPDTDRTDIASSIEKNSPLSTSLASGESLPASYRSVTQINNLQAYVETPNTANAPSGSSAATNIPPNQYHYS